MECAVDGRMNEPPNDRCMGVVNGEMHGITRKVFCTEFWLYVWVQQNLQGPRNFGSCCWWDSGEVTICSPPLTTDSQ